MKMKKLFKASAFALVFAASVSVWAAGVKTQTVEAIGTGVTRAAAINTALVEAVSQVSGVRIDAKSASSSAYASATVADDKQEETSSLAFEAAANQIATETGGMVRSYQVISIDEEPQTQLVRAKLSVDVSYFEKGKSTSRMRIAVLPFESISAKTSPDVAEQFALNLNQSTVNYLTGTRHFAIVDRDFEGARAGELSMLLRDDVPREERARLGNTLPADYILTGRILELSATQQSSRDPYTGETVTTTKGQARVQWRLIEASTGQISVSSTETLPIRSQAAVVDNGEAIGRTIGEQITETIYPLAAIAFENGELVIAQGGETIKPGDRYALMRQGAIRKDPYTGEQMGRNETPVGEVRITRVTPKMSYAQVIKCSVDLKGMAPREYLLRKVEGSSARTGAPTGAPRPAPVAQPAW